MTIVYKVVSISNSDKWLLSYNLPWSRSLLCVEYKVGETTQPKIEGTPLMAFRSLKDVRKFLGGTLKSDYSEVYEAEAEIFDEDLPLLIGDLQHTTVAAKCFWEEIQEGKTPFNSLPAPKGTVFCKSIKLIKKVSK